MNLITFNSTNSNSTRKGEATVRFNRRGPNSISATACEKFGLKDGDLIAVHQDQDNPADWYISKDEKGIRLRKQSADSRGLYFNSAGIANIMLDALGVEDVNALFHMGEIVTVKKVNYYTIITATV